MLIADLYCGAGGAAVGISRACEKAGLPHRIIGFDIKKQRHYPFEFVQQDALTVELKPFDAVWASPPCQAYSLVANHSRHAGKSYPDLVADTWWMLYNSETAWIIENVPHAPIKVDLMLCGSMFDPPMFIRRHRIFESNIPLALPIWPCRHALMGPRFEVYEHYKKRLSSTVRVNGGYTKGAAEAMGIDWMSNYELTQAVPPVYAEYVWTQLIAAWLGGVKA